MLRSNTGIPTCRSSSEDIALKRSTSPFCAARCTGPQKMEHFAVAPTASVLVFLSSSSSASTLVFSFSSSQPSSPPSPPSPPPPSSSPFPSPPPPSPSSSSSSFSAGVAMFLGGHGGARHGYDGYMRYNRNFSPFPKSLWHPHLAHPAKEAHPPLSAKRWVAS